MRPGPARRARAAASRRAAALALGVALALLALSRAAVAADAALPAVRSVGITVSDAERAAAFFEGVLGFAREGGFERFGPDVERLTGVFGARIRVERVRLGKERVELTQFLTPRGAAIPPDSRSQDRWFQHVALVVRDIDAAYARLRAHGVEHVSTAVQTLPDWNPAAGGIRAFYFRDPDGHNLELIWFPPGKGDPRWQAPAEALFLGIDHTAIGVGATAAGLRFWRDALGLAVAGESHNHGTEQEHLNLVFGARLVITGLRARGGPGVEFLEYVTPGDGRPYPADARPNDLLHWETTVEVEDLDALLPRLDAAGVRRVSPDPVALPADVFGFSRALLVRDPDGHAVRLVER